MDDILESPTELEVMAARAGRQFLALMLLGEEEFFTRIQTLRLKLKAVDVRSSRGVLALALMLSREQRQLAESLLRD